MDKATMAAIAELPAPAGDEDEAFGFASADEKAFLFRALGSLCQAGLPLRAAASRVAATLGNPAGEAAEAARLAHFAARVVAAIDAPAGDAPGDPFGSGGQVQAILMRADVLLQDVERCMLSFTLEEADGAALASAFDRALSWVTAMQARVAEGVRARAAR